MPTALIVEDEPEANKLLAMLLQLRGYRTESAYLRSRGAGEDPRPRPGRRVPRPDAPGHGRLRGLPVAQVAGGRQRASPSSSSRPGSRPRTGSRASRRGPTTTSPSPTRPTRSSRPWSNPNPGRTSSMRRGSTARSPLDARDDGEALRQLAHLRRLLQIRCGMELRRHRPDQLGDQGALVEHRRVVAAATRGAGGDPGLLAHAGGADADHPRRGRMARRHVAAGGADRPVRGRPFDEVIRDESGRSLTLVKRCRQPEGRP